jgi:FSR family fosmidomycin resistance protein-like MFS transporter
MAENSKKFRTGQVALISFAHFIHDVYSSFLAPILPLLIDKLSFSYSLAGTLAIFQRIPAIFNPLVGLIADKLSVRYFMIAAPTITAVSMSLLGAAPSYIWLIILLFIMGIGASLFHVPAPVMIKKVSGIRTGKGMSFFMLGGELARSVGPIVILSAVSIWGLEGTFRLIPVGLIASLLLFLRFRKIRISDNIKKSKKELGLRKTIKKVMPLFLSIAGFSFFTAIMKGSLTAFLPIYMTDQGETIWTGGISLSVLQLSGAIGTFSSGTLSDKIGRKKTLFFIVIFSPLLMWLFISIGGIFVYPILFLLGFFVFATTPVFLAIVNEFSSEREAFINGIYMTVNFVTGAVSVLIVGLLSDLLGIRITYKICATIVFFALPFLLVIPEKRRHREE